MIHVGWTPTVEQYQIVTKENMEKIQSEWDQQPFNIVIFKSVKGGRYQIRFGFN